MPSMLNSFTMKFLLTVSSLTCSSSCAFSSVRVFSAGLCSGFCAPLSSSEPEPGLFWWAAVHSSLGEALWQNTAKRLLGHLFFIFVQFKTTECVVKQIHNIFHAWALCISYDFECKGPLLATSLNDPAQLGYPAQRQLTPYPMFTQHVAYVVSEYILV